MLIYKRYWGTAERFLHECFTLLKENVIEKVYQTVKTALTEMNEYNTSDRAVVLELWSVDEHRKASLKEVVEFIVDSSNWLSYKLSHFLQTGFPIFIHTP